MRKKEQQLFLTEEFQIINGEGMSEMGKSLLEYNNDNYHRQAAHMNAKISRRKSEKKQDICIILQSLP